MSRELLKEAIADAKAVKEAAIANAKAALEEAFTPHLKELLASKLESLDESEEMEEMMKKRMKEEEMDGMEEMMYGEEKSLEELDLEEILAELEGSIEEEDEMMNEAKKKDESDDESEEEEKEEKSEKKGDDDLVGEMTEEDLKALIMSVFDEMGVEAGPGGEGDMADLESDVMAGEEAGMGDEETPEDLEEIDLAALMEEIMLEEAKKKGKMAKKKEEEEEKKDDEKEMMKEDLQEAYSTIKTLRSELNEVNLLNAKLLYTNKIFKAKNLTESQKVKVLSTFDRATTVKEVKLVFESLNTTITTSNNITKAPIKESMGFASRTSATVKQNQTIETDAVIARMKKLAGL
jgi:hypothetical protein